MAEIADTEENLPARPLTFIDLFCGCGGFSLGLIRAGFRCLAAIDFNPEAAAVFRENFPEVPHVLQEDLTAFPPSKLETLLGTETPDVIVGGPPCQGFSTVRQVDAANHGSRVKRDKRRYLFRAFLDYVKHFQPRAFVMENVLGIQSAAKGKFFTLVQAEARKLGYRVHAQVEEAWKLGVPQKRRRQLIVGIRWNVPGFISELTIVQRLTPPHTPDDNTQAIIDLRSSLREPALWDAIGDLPPLRAGEGVERRPYDLERRKVFLEERDPFARRYLENVLEISRAGELTAHRARPHNERDLRDFARLREGETAGQAIERGERMEFPYNRNIFFDRYTRQHRERLCSTIVAHLGKDGLMFIHPTQNRSLTPREAARVQSFPDWFQFPVARTHQFRLIGNAVPPLVAEAVGEELLRLLQRQTEDGGIRTEEEDAAPCSSLSLLPESETEAVAWLIPLLDDASPGRLGNIPLEAFKRAWSSIAFLSPGLHPDAALDHGSAISRQPQDGGLPLTGVDPRLLAPYYERSGWPVVLAPIVREAWRRYRAGALADEEFYCAEAQMAGIRHRMAAIAVPEIKARDFQSPTP